LHEGYEPIAFQRENQMRERCPLELLREEWPLAVRFPVNDDRPARRERKCGAGPSIFERFTRDYGYRRQTSVHRTHYFSNRCRQQNLMSKSNQCLREPFEQRHIGPDENHFDHYGVFLSQPGVEPIPGLSR
jgi:hypothetical protein